MTDHESTVTDATPEGISDGLQRIGVPEPLANVLAEGFAFNLQAGGLAFENAWISETPGAPEVKLWSVLASKLDNDQVRVMRSLPVTTDEDERAPPLDEQVRLARLRVAADRNVVAEMHARVLMANAYAGAVESVARGRFPAQHENEIAQRELLRLVRELRESSERFTDRRVRGGGWPEVRHETGTHLYAWPGDGLEDGLPSWDAALVRFLERHEKKASAAKVRERGAGRAAGLRLWALWIEDEQGSPPVVRLLANAFADEIKRALEASKPPSLTRYVHAATLDVLSHPPKATSQLAIRGTAVRVAEDALDALANGAFESLRTLYAIRLFHHLVTEGHDAREANGPSTREVWLHFPDGYVGLAKRLGLPANHAAPELRKAAWAMSKCELTHTAPGGSVLRASGMIFIAEDTRAGRNPDVRIMLSDPLLHGFAHVLDSGNSATARRDRQLVPVIRTLPDFVGRNRKDHAAQMRFALSIPREMRDRAAELVEHGGVLMPWRQLQQRAGMRTPWERVVETWSKPGSMLVHRDGRYTLSDVHEAERKEIEDAGRLSIRQSNRAKVAVAKRKRKGHGA